MTVYSTQMGHPYHAYCGAHRTSWPIEQKEPSEGKERCEMLSLGHNTAAVHQKTKPGKHFRMKWAGNEALP